MADLNSQLQALSEQYTGDTKQYLKTLADDKVNLATDALNKAIKSETGFDNTMGMVNMGIMGAKGTFGSLNTLRKVYNKYSETKTNKADVKENVNESQNTNEDVKTDEPTETDTPQPTETEMSDVVGEDVGKETTEADIKEPTQLTELAGESVEKDVGEQVAKTAATTAVSEGVEEGVGFGLAQLLPGLDVVADIGMIGGLIYSAVHGAKKAKEEHAKQESYDNQLKKENDIDNMSLELTSISAPTRSRQQELQGGISTSD